jgi:hypothetical protein
VHSTTPSNAEMNGSTHFAQVHNDAGELDSDEEQLPPPPEVVYVQQQQQSVYQNGVRKPMVQQQVQFRNKLQVTSL